MKILTVLFMLTISTVSQASVKCSIQAKKSAIEFAKEQQIILIAKEFKKVLINSYHEISMQTPHSQNETHSFFNTSFGIVSEFEYKDGTCTLSNIYTAQNDQDLE